MFTLLRNSVQALAMAFLTVSMPLLAEAEQERTPLPVVAKLDPLRRQMLLDLDLLRYNFETLYGPIQWKQEHWGWNLDTETDFAKAQVLGNPKISIKEYQKVVKKFLYSARDYHVSPYFYRTESAMLGFSIASAEGRYFITEIQDPDLTEMAVGDEVFELDHTPVDRVAKKLIANDQRGANPLTDQAKAENLLTVALGFLGNDVPRGNSHLRIRTREGEFKDIDVQWRYQPEVVHDILGAKGMDQRKPIKKNLKERFTDFLMASNLAQNPYYSEFKRLGMNKGSNPRSMGSYKSHVPELGEIIATGPSELLYTYVFQLEDGRKIGYIRIPEHWDDVDLAAQSIYDLGNALLALQEDTEMLVIDQVNNPGGLIVHCETAVQLLATKTVTTYPQHERLTQASVCNAIELLDAFRDINTQEDAEAAFGASVILGYPVLDVVESFRAHASFVVDQWNQGKVYTDLTHGWFPSTLQPIVVPGETEDSPPRIGLYTKPILVLINELDGSCGDIFPAMLQDHKRAVLMGTRTAGAGGFVTAISHPNPFGLRAFSITGSLLKRPNGQAIEDLGVTPDVEYRLTAADLQDGYQGYKAAILSQIQRMLD